MLAVRPPVLSSSVLGAHFGRGLKISTMAVAIQGTNPRLQRLLMRLLWYPGKSLPVYCMIVLLILLPDGSCIQAVDVDGLSPLLTTNGYSVGGEAELAEDR